MAVERVKIVLDADVIIHFSKGECLSILPEIFPEYKITYLTTVDFLYYACRKGLMSAADCKSFISDVRAKGSRLPDIEDISQHTPAYLLC